MNAKIKLQTGRLIHLQSILFLNTYRGFLEGDQLEINKRLLWEFQSQADKLLEGTKSWDGIPRLCINSDSFLGWSKSKFPPIQCCGEFLSYQPARDNSKHASTLVVVWFQNEIHPVISSENQSHMESLNWDSHAQDFEW